MTNILPTGKFTMNILKRIFRNGGSFLHDSQCVCSCAWNDKLQRYVRCSFTAQRDLLCDWCGSNQSSMDCNHNDNELEELIEWRKISNA